MADTEDVDPQYRWILPTYLEVTPQLMDEMTDNQADKTLSSAGPPAWPEYIAWIGDVSNEERIQALQGALKDKKDAIRSITNERWKDERHGWPPYVSKSAFVDCQMALLALQHIGLDVHGGVRRLWEVGLICRYTKERFLMNSIVVNDPTKARKYVGIGVHLDSNASFCKEPLTLGEVAEDYIRISKLITCYDASAWRGKDIEEQIEERLRIGKKSNLDWEFAREKFRLQTLKKFKDALVAKAVEEKDSEARARKRARTEK